MIIVAFIVFGGAIGIAIDIAWASVDLLLGATTLTMDRGIGVIGLCIVGLAGIVGCLMAWDELR